MAKIQIKSEKLTPFEEGRIKDKKANIDYYGSDIRGTVVITAADGESFRSLTTSEIQSARIYLMKNSIE